MAARRVFLDTNGWIALLNSSDTLHTPAEAAWNGLLRQGYSIFLTDWIVAETGNGLAPDERPDPFRALLRDAPGEPARPSGPR